MKKLKESIVRTKGMNSDGTPMIEMMETIRWVTPPEGDGCGWMASPISYDNPDGLWEVMDCEGDTLCICQKETAVWLHMLLRKFENIQTDYVWDKTGYCKRIAAEMVDGFAGMGGSWDEFIQVNK